MLGPKPHAGEPAAVTMVPTGPESDPRPDWTEIREELRRAAASRAVSGEELELLASAERFAGEPGDVVRTLEAAHAAHLRAGDSLGAARAALQLVLAHGDSNETAPAGAWLERASAMLQGQSESAEHALLAWLRGRRLGDAGRLEAHEAMAREALAIALRVGSPSVESLARLDLGHVAVARGEVADGLEQTDRATALALGGDVGPLETGLVFCGAVWTCRSCGRWSQAEQWARTADRWSERERTRYFPGLCRIHRAEVLRARGRLEEAERECLEAVRLLQSAIPRWAMIAHTELGEVRRRRGDFPGAMEAFRRALELGWEPQPGLSLLMLAQGDAQAAHRAIERAFASELPTWLQEDRTNLLRGRATVALAAGEYEVARAAVRELEERAAGGEEAWDLASAAQARGELELACGDAKAAVDALVRAKRSWSRLATPYEQAIAGALLGRALEVDGDPAGARIEVEAARATLERIGAHFEAESMGPSPERSGAVAAAPPSGAGRSRFLREGDVWALTHAGRTVRLRRTRGLDLLARLLSRPDEEVAALALAADSAAIPVEGRPGESLDREARDAYRRRLLDLEEELDQARAHDDEARKESIAEELESLHRELAASLGLGGRPRSGPSAAERARQSVTKAIRAAIRRIGEEHPALGRHLESSVRTGALCRYAPENPVVWEVSPRGPHGPASPEITS